MGVGDVSTQCRGHHDAVQGGPPFEVDAAPDRPCSFLVPARFSSLAQFGLTLYFLWETVPNTHFRLSPTYNSVFSWCSRRAPAGTILVP